MSCMLSLLTTSEVAGASASQARHGRRPPNSDQLRVTVLHSVESQPLHASTRMSALSDSSQTHRPHHEYSFRLPTPPRIVVPPPTLVNEIPQLQLSCNRTSRGHIDLSFLEDLSLDTILQKNTLLEWAYERRRQAQMILPWLYLGPLTVAKDKNFLQQEGITMVLAVRAKETSMTGALQAAAEVCPEVAAIEAADYSRLIGKFPDTTRTINQHISTFWEKSKRAGTPKLGKVLVFCESGNEKAAVVVAAYMMETLDDFDHIKSMQVCQTQRFCVTFNDVSKNILQAYWDILLAKRSVATYYPGQPEALDLTEMMGVHSMSSHAPASACKSKRRIEETRDDEDVEMADGLDPSDLLRFEGRDLTPFK